MERNENEVMRHKLVIDGNAVYEIDDDCLKCRRGKRQEEGQEKEAEIYGAMQAYKSDKSRLYREGERDKMNKNTQKP